MGNSSLPDETLRAFRAASKEFDAIYARYAKNCGLSETEYWALLMIRNGFKTQAEISNQLLISRQTIHSAFKQLVKKRLVRLEPLENNQRTKEITLTEVGERFMVQHIDRMLEIEQQAWITMEEGDRLLLTQLTRKYCGLIQQILQNNTIESSSSEDLSSQ